MRTHRNVFRSVARYLVYAQDTFHLMSWLLGCGFSLGYLPDLSCSSSPLYRWRDSATKMSIEFLKNKDRLNGQGKCVFAPLMKLKHNNAPDQSTLLHNRKTSSFYKAALIWCGPSSGDCSWPERDWPNYPVLWRNEISCLHSRSIRLNTVMDDARRKSEMCWSMDAGELWLENNYASLKRLFGLIWQVLPWEYQIPSKAIDALILAQEAVIHVDKEIAP